MLNSFLQLFLFLRYFRQSKAFVPVHLETEKMAMDKYYHQENAVLQE
jgi:phosphomevalonate kinase